MQLNASGYTTLRGRKLQAMTVLELAAKGLSINDICEKTGYGHHKVQNILAGINERAKQEMSYIIQTRIPLEYEKSLFMLDACLKRCWEIDGRATEHRVSLMAINTILQIQDSKSKLLSDSAMISRAIQKAAIVLPVKHSKTAGAISHAGEIQPTSNPSKNQQEIQLNRRVAE